MKYSYLLFFLFFSWRTIGQTHERSSSSRHLNTEDSSFYCASDHLHQQKLKSDDTYRQLKRTWESATYSSVLQSRKKESRTAAEEAYTIPVVVHVVHDNGTENISDQQILAGIQHLNDAFAMRSPYIGTNGTTIGIQFCLARQDANGLFTTGINRIVSPLTNMDAVLQDQQLKDLSRWDPNRYLNIWLVKEICDGADCAPAGYSFLAFAHGLSYDGIVCEARRFGSSPDNSKVHVHETGHYLNLYHTFEGGCGNSNCLTDGDQVCDTPPDASASSVLPCQAIVNSCISDADDHSTANPFRPVAFGGTGDQSDMFNNYMDYSNLSCQNAFTEGQKDRMILALTTLRASLLISKGCEISCRYPITSFFIPSSTAITVGTSVTFTNMSVNDVGAHWSINGIPFASSRDASYTFLKSGRYTITLFSSNTDVSCNQQSSVEVEVTCPVIASYSYDRSTLTKGETLVLTNTSANATHYNWLVDGQLFTSEEEMTYTFNASGNYSIMLIANNAFCKDTSLVTFTVIDPLPCIYRGKEGYNWYFGNKAGISFHTTPPVALTDGEMNTAEGCASVSDFEGNLLFYTDGISVWNKHHMVMPNGNGLLGSSSTTQSALCVPVPGQDKVYYVFTLANAESKGVDGFRYSVVDMRLENGDGDVTVKNTLLQAPCTEKLAAVRHANGKDFWIVAHEFRTNRFWSYLLTETGLSVSPVLSDVGTVDLILPTGGKDAIGSMKISPNGKRLAFVLGNLGAVELFNFNDLTGEITDPLLLPSINYPYGLEFSPDNKKLYVSADTLFQFDLSSPSPAAVLQSKFPIALIDNSRGALQVGPDDKIYLAILNNPYLSCIHTPNASGASCNFVEDAIFLENRISRLGLPTYMSGYYINPLAISGPERLCANDKSIPYTISHGNLPVTLTVEGGEIVSFENDTAIVNFYDVNGAMMVATAINCGKLLRDTLFIRLDQVPRPDLGADLVYCNPFTKVLDAGTYTSYEWQDGSSNQTFTATTGGTYYVRVKKNGLNNCTSSDTVLIDVLPLPVIELKDTSICSNSVLVLHAGSGFTNYRWEDGSVLNTHTIFRAGKYYVQATHPCGLFKDTCSVYTYPVPDVTFDLPDVLCKDNEAIELHGIPQGGSFAGTGVLHNMFDPSKTEVGMNIISYSYTTLDGCQETITQQLTVTDKCNLYIPNLITPNSDGLNDTFFIRGLPEGSRLEIFNRWNNLIYRAEEYTNNWDGNDQSGGVYFYLLQIGGQQYKGWLHVLK